MAGSVETITTYVILLVELVRYGIEVSVVGHCAVEGVVEHANLRCVRHELVYSTQTFEVASVVNGSEVAQTLDAILYALVNNDALLEEVATLHDTVTYCIYLVKALDSTYFRVEQTLEYEVDTFLVVGHVVHDLLLLAVRQSHLDECFVKTDTLNTACCEDRVVVHVVQLVFD